MVEIIPRPTKGTPAWQIALFYFAILLIIALIVVYFVLGYFQGKSKLYIRSIEERLSEGKTDERMALEKELLDYKIQISNISALLENHIVTTRFFDFLEKNTHPRTFFFQTQLSSKDKLVVFSGITDSFSSLGQQLLMLDKEPLARDVALTNVSIGETGGVWFGLNILLSPEVFKY